MMKRGREAITAQRVAGRASVVLALVSLSGLASCGCDDSLQFGLTLKVLSTIGEPICDATVRVTVGDRSEVLHPFRAGADCQYTGLPEGSGHFVATATAAGYRPNSLTGDIGGDSCHVSGQALEIRLETN